MKKSIIFLMLTIFLVVSCSSSKKAENDADILPDEDGINDDDADLDDEDETDYEEPDEDEDATEDTDPCDPNPCFKIENSNGECTAKNTNKYSCGCVDGYFWNGEKCINPCSGVSCSQFEHGTGECRTDNAFTFRCDCDEGYYWWGGNKGCLNKKPDAVNVCTGQNKCYNNEKEIPCPAEGEDFFGAQYARLGYCMPQNYSIDYSVENEPVVVDNNTGMMWQQKIPPIEELYIEEVNGYCNNLVYGGYDDWRLPSVTDFVTITDFGRYDPAIKTEYFPDYGSFWTSNKRVDSGYIGDLPHIYYYTYYYSSIFDFKEPLTFQTTTLSYYTEGNSILYQDYHNYAYSYNIRCVRGSDTESSTFTSKTFGKNLMWNYNNDTILVKKTGAKHTWQEALKYCSELDYAGISDWRLPNVRELYLTGNTGVHSSTTKMASLDSDYSETKETTLKETTRNNTLCIANDSCEDGKFWNGEKCAKNPCAGNPCKSDSNSNGTCMVLDEENHLCGCNKNYKWSPEKRQCVRTCQDNPCSTYSNSDKQCYDDDVEGFYCGCVEPYYWNSEKHTCSKKCDSDPCADKENSDGHCSDDTEHGYVCGCIDGYVWLPFYDMCSKNLCISDPCENIENSDGTCEINEYLGRECGCIEGYTWNFSDGECQ